MLVLASVSGYTSYDNGSLVANETKLSSRVPVLTGMRGLGGADADVEGPAAVPDLPSSSSTSARTERERARGRPVLCVFSLALAFKVSFAASSAEHMPSLRASSSRTCKGLADDATGVLIADVLCSG